MEWGKIYVGEDTKKPYKDVRIWHGVGGDCGVEEWNWGSTGTHHDPGIQIADIQPFLSSVDYVILSQGQEGKLKCTPDAILYAAGMGKAVMTLSSVEAVEKYNQLVQKGFSVGALVHSTC